MREAGAAMPRRVRQLDDPQVAFHAFMDGQPYDIYNGKTVNVKDIGKRERPAELPDMFKQTREWAAVNWFVNTVLLLKGAFANYRPSLRCASQESAPRKKFDKWLETRVSAHGETVEMQVGDYLRGAVAEWFLNDNLISFWRKDGEFPYPLRPETVCYSDAFGLEKLKLRVDLTERQLLEQGVPAAQARRFGARGEVELSEEYGEHWLVARRGGRGYGLVVPRLHTIFRTLSQWESMEVGESMYAYAGRLVVRFHQLGFEVKSAQNALRQPDFLWKKSRAEAIEKFFKARHGFVETTGQFDHKISHIWTDPKLYENKKWLTITDRLLVWAGPMGYLLMGKITNLPLMNLLRTEIEADRAVLKPHLEAVINEAFAPPGGACLRWDNRCFTDPRLAWDQVKTLAMMGPLSPQTALETSGYDPETEAGLKVEAADDKASEKKYLPLYDPHHGNAPAGEGRRGPKAGLKQRQEPDPGAGGE